jgi:hypothetical protein
MPAPASQAQARLFGAIAGGEKKVPGFSAAEAKTRLRGVNVSALPLRKKKRSIRTALGY